LRVEGLFVFPKSLLYCLNRGFPLAHTNTQIVSVGKINIPASGSHAFSLSMIAHFSVLFFIFRFAHWNFQLQIFFLRFCHFFTTFAAKNSDTQKMFSFFFCQRVLNTRTHTQSPTRSRSSDEKLGPLAKNPERTGWGIDFGSLASG